ncbi:hypothetical protein AVEN_127852-1 [Araneus ventricosus]|uniref:Uncharacterized protein n=1 Tax=Araneus ventricosus TaxID=182803 RepID=A0A4Y1ZZH0_ARAVE|nr:hypothetical protein AVEN_127852-1 [Araneus ventricosus]
MARATPEMVLPLQISAPHPAGKRLALYASFSVQQVHIHVGTSVESCFVLEPSGSIAETLPLGHRGLNESTVKESVLKFPE